MLIINFILLVLLWVMCDEAVEDGRTGWGFCYLFLSAANGAAILTNIF